VAKVIAPPDLLRHHADLTSRVTWLETHSTNGPSDVARLVPHIHDIVEHLFRGSTQAFTGAAPFGHLAAHFWEMEHEDPHLDNNWEFHRKMRVMRERVGANRPLVDSIGTQWVWIRKGGEFAALSYGWSYYNTKIHYDPWHVVMSPGRPAFYNLVARDSLIVQPLAFPGDPARQVDERLKDHPGYPYYLLYEYYRPEGSEVTEGGETVYFPAVGPKQSGYSLNEEYNIETKDRGTAKQARNEEQHTTDEAVGVATPGMAPNGPGGGIVEANSQRWPAGFKIVTPSITIPNPELITSDGPLDAIYENEMPEDIFIWSGVNIERAGFYVAIYRDEGPLFSVATKKKLYVYDLTYNAGTKRTGVHGGMWYLGVSPFIGEYNPKTGSKGSWMAYIPADLVQSPGPPVDYDGTQPLPKFNAGSADPEQPGGNWNNSSAIDFADPEKPLRTFDEALALFAAEIVKPEWAELVEFWERHTADFKRRGSAFNHAWVRAGGISSIGHRVYYLKRYGYVHLRGKLFENGSVAAGPTNFVWSLPEGIPLPIEPVMTFTVNSNFGPILLRVERRGFAGNAQFVIPEYADMGPRAESGLLYIDLDGVTWPYV
jgi:hypothetical protein